MIDFDYNTFVASLRAGTLSVEAAGSGALHCADLYGETIAFMRGKLKGKSEDVVRATLLPVVAAHYDNIPLVDGAGKAQGKKVLDKDAPKYEAAKKALQRLIADIMGKGSDKSDKYEIPEDMLAAAAKLVKLAKGYDEKVMRTLAAQALAAAWLAK